MKITLGIRRELMTNSTVISTLLREERVEPKLMGCWTAKTNCAASNAPQVFLS